MNGFVESNLPESQDDIGIGDNYVDVVKRRPGDWRWRLPDLDDLKRENSDMRMNQQFSCYRPTLDSFAAFSAGEVVAYDIQGRPLDSSGQVMGDSILDQPVTASPNTTQNVWTDALSGLVRGITPAAQAAITAAIAPPTYVQRPVVQTPQQLAAQQKLGGLSTGTMVMIGGAVLLGVVLLMSSNK